MPLTHFLLVLLVVMIWGVNFIFVKFGLDELSPLLLCAMRFILASIPAVFFIRPPAIPFRIIALYGLFMFALQFLFLFMGMNAGMTPGMASLIMQLQVFISMFLVAFILGEKPSLIEIAGALLAFSGIGLVAMHFDQNISLWGFLFVLAGSVSWGIGNLISKKASKVNMIALVVWGCFIAAFPMTILALIFEGPASIAQSFHQLTWHGVEALIYIVYVSTWLGYGIWNWLLARHSVGLIVPFTLLIPLVGMASSALVLGETFELWKIEAGLLVISGLCVNVFGKNWFKNTSQDNTEDPSSASAAST